MADTRGTGPSWSPRSARQRRQRAPSVPLLARLCLAAAASSALAVPALAQDTADFFRQNCASCHTIGGGRLTGPDLKDVEKRQERDWLVRFMLDPQAVIDGGDPYAAKLKQEARGVVMPKVVGINRQRAESLLALIAEESAKERSLFAGAPVSNEPFTPDDVERGRETFLGLRRLESGAPACISCHTTAGTGGLGGGRLGPDLTQVYERLQGRKGLTAWLFAPATPTMQSVFKAMPFAPEEIHALTAYLEDEARRGGQADMSGPLGFLLLGLGGAAAGLALMDAAWRGRFRAVRRRLAGGQGGNPGLLPGE